MDTLSHALDLMRQDCYMDSIDLIYAYYSVPVALSDQKSLLFQFYWVRYKYVCMLHSLFSVPRISTKLLKPVLSTLRKQGNQAMNYVDHFFLVGDNFEECLKAVEDSADLLSRLWFQIKIGKSVFMPTQKTEYLVFTLNFKDMTVTLTKEKQEKLSVSFKQLVKFKRIKIRDIVKVLMTFEAVLRSIKYGRLHLFYL